MLGCVLIFGKRSYYVSMEQIDDCCHQFEWLHQQRHQHMSAINPTEPHIPTAVYQSLDTVRALHQTVVYLRKALEKAHREIDSLKKQITVKGDIEEGKKYREQEFVAKSNHLDSLLLDIGSIEASDTRNSDDIKLQAQSVRNDKINLKKNESKAFDEYSAQHQSTESVKSNSSPVQSPEYSHKTTTTTTKHTQSAEHHFQHSLKTHEIQSTDYPIQTHLEEKQSKNYYTVDTSTTLSDGKLPQMASKIDVKIKLTSHFQIDGNDTSSETTGDSVSGILFICLKLFSQNTKSCSFLYV